MKKRWAWAGLAVAVIGGLIVLAYLKAPPRFLFLTGFEEVNVKPPPGLPKPPDGSEFHYYVGQVSPDLVRDRFVKGLKNAAPLMAPNNPADSRNRMWFATDPVTGGTIVALIQPDTYPTDGNMVGTFGNRPGWTMLSVATQRETFLARVRRFFRF